MTASTVQFLTQTNGIRLAYQHHPGSSPGILFLSGFNSSMQANKAQFLLDYSKKHGIEYLCFDYLGHGNSDGEFKKSTLGDWINNAELMLDQVCKGQQLLIGSSMGAWIMLHLALRQPKRIAAMLGIASAVDFTEDFLWRNMSEKNRTELQQVGETIIASDYEQQGYVISQELLDEARQHLLLKKPLRLSHPLQLLHGLADTDVPWQQSLKVLQHAEQSDIELCLYKDFDHRFSSSLALEKMLFHVEQLRNPAKT